MNRRRLFSVAALLAFVTGRAILLAGAQQTAPRQTAPPGRQYAPGSRNFAQMGGRANPRRPGRKNVLAWIDVRNGFQHDSISHAVSVIERLGYDSGVYDTYIRSDSQPITKHGMFGSDGQEVYGHDLNDFDAIFFFGVREIDLTAQQRADLLSFVHDDGKGFVAAHAAATAFMSWPAFGQMLGGRFDGHPWGVIAAPIIVEQPGFPGMSSFHTGEVLTDEMYQIHGVDRANTDVLLRLDPRHLDLKHAGVHNLNGDFPLAWAKTYGKGRVFYSALGHDLTTWDNPQIQQMYFQAIQWALGLTPGPVRPHGRRRR